MINDERRRIKDKVDFFLSEKVKVHVELRDKTFLNGYLEKELRENVYWFIDDKLGGVYLFLGDVYDIDKFNEIKKGVGR